MEHENVVNAGIEKAKMSGVEKKELNIHTKESKMDGIDPGLVALLKQNGMGDGQGNYQWNNPLFWIIILGFLRGRGGIFGGGEGEGVAAGATQAKLDCLAQGQQDAAANAHNMNITNLLHSAEMNATNNTNRIAAQLAECCCNLKSGQKDIVNEMLKCCCDIKAALCDQTNTLVTEGTANTQRIVDIVNAHANAETQSKLTDCKSALSNCQQTSELKTVAAGLSAQIAQVCGNGNGHGGRSRTRVRGEDGK